MAHAQLAPLPDESLTDGADLNGVDSIQSTVDSIQSTNVPRIIVLKNGNHFFAVAVREADKLAIHTGDGSRIVIPVTGIDFYCDSLVEAYWMRAARTRATDVDGQIGLFRWCLKNELPEFASLQLQLLSETDVPIDQIGVFQRQLSVAVDARDGNYGHVKDDLPQERSQPDRFDGGDRNQIELAAGQALAPIELFEFYPLPEIAPANHVYDAPNGIVSQTLVEEAGNEFDIRPLPPIYQPVVPAQYADTGANQFLDGTMPQRDNATMVASRSGQPLIPRLPLTTNTNNSTDGTPTALSPPNDVESNESASKSGSVAQVAFQEDVEQEDVGQDPSASSSAPREPTRNSGPTNEEMEQLTRSLPQGTVGFYKRKIEPVLVRSCFTAGCHNQEAEHMPLQRMSRSGTIPRRLSQENLYSVIRYTDANEPLFSSLLSHAETPHGGVGENDAKTELDRFLDRDSVQFKNLATWLIAISNNPAGPHELPLPEGYEVPENVAVFDSGNVQLPPGPTDSASTQLNHQTIIEQSPMDAVRSFDDEFGNGIGLMNGITMPEVTAQPGSNSLSVPQLNVAPLGAERLDSFSRNSATTADRPVLDPALDPLALPIDPQPEVEIADPHCADIFNSQIEQ